MKQTALIVKTLLGLSIASLLVVANAQEDDAVEETETALPKVLQTLEAQGVEIVGELDTPADIKAYAAIAK